MSASDAPAALDALIATAAEAAINGYLRLDPDNAARLAPLYDQPIELLLQNPALMLRLNVNAGGVRVRAGAPPADGAGALPPRVSIRATPRALWRLARGEPGAEREVYIQGDMHTAQALQRLLGDLDIDREALLAQAIGDLPAYQLGRLGRGAFGYGRRLAARFEQDLADYLHFESGDLPPRSGVEAFLDDVDRLRADVDRLEARVRRLQQSSRD